MKEEFFYSFPIAKRLLQAQKRGTLGHSYLIYGNNHNLLEEFTFQLLAHILFNANPTKNLEDFQEQMTYLSYPYLRIIKPENKSNTISVDSIRELIQQFAVKISKNNYKIAIIFFAEKMNKQSQNAFLKSLEEPTQNTLFFLLTTQKNLLLETTLSRCQKIPIFNNEQIKFPPEIEDLKKDFFNLGLRFGIDLFYKIKQCLDTYKKKVYKDNEDAIIAELKFKNFREKLLIFLEQLTLERLKDEDCISLEKRLNDLKKLKDMLQFEFYNDLFIQNFCLKNSIEKSF